MNKVICLALVAAFVAVASAGEISFGRCDMTGTVLSVAVSGCNASPCTLKKGSTYDIDVAFVPSHDGTELSYKIDGKVGIITIPISSGNGCSGLDTGCPYSGGVLNSHRTTITLSQQLIETDAQVILKFTDGASRNQVCVTAEVTIVS